MANPPRRQRPSGPRGGRRRAASSASSSAATAMSSLGASPWESPVNSDMDITFTSPELMRFTSSTTEECGCRRRSSSSSSSTSSDECCADRGEATCTYVQEGTLPTFDPTILNRITLVTTIPFERRSAVDMWIRDSSGVWHQPGDFQATYAVQVQPDQHPEMYKLTLVLPAGTAYLPGNAYSLVITFRD